MTVVTRRRAVSHSPTEKPYLPFGVGMEPKDDVVLDDQPLLQTLAPHEALTTFAPGTVLFRESTTPLGVHVLLSGAVDLHFVGRNGDRPLQVAEAGTILGLSSLMSGRPQEYTATAASTLVTGFVDSTTFFRVLNETPALWLAVLKILSRDISSCYDRVRALALPSRGHGHLEAR